jgi:hypothetical protein
MSMANSVSNLPLSGSNHGRGIKITGTNTAGAVTVHQAINDTVDLDNVWIEAYNSHTAAVDVTIEWGGTSAPDDHIKAAVPPGQGLFVLAAGLPLRNNLTIKAFAGTANVVVLYGFVHRVEAA